MKRRYSWRALVVVSVGMTESAVACAWEVDWGSVGAGGEGRSRHVRCSGPVLDVETFRLVLVSSSWILVQRLLCQLPIGP